MEEDTELNLIPIMNVFMVMIPFLLMFAAFYHLKAINTSIPVHGVVTADTENTPSKEAIKITVVLELKEREIRISALSSQLTAVELAEFEVALNRPAGGDLSVMALGDYLQRVKARYPASDTLLLIPDEGVLYKEIVEAMDCARSRDADALFPNVVLAGSLG
jgi:biopolymer transport protein ExbD